MSISSISYALGYGAENDALNASSKVHLIKVLLPDCLFKPLTIMNPLKPLSQPIIIELSCAPYP